MTTRSQLYAGLTVLVVLGSYLVATRTMAQNKPAETHETRIARLGANLEKLQKDHKQLQEDQKKQMQRMPILSERIVLDHNDGKVPLSGVSQATVSVKFPPGSFSKSPRVLTSLERLDVGPSYSNRIRVNCRATKITADGFELVIDARLNPGARVDAHDGTYMHCELSWIAIDAEMVVPAAAKVEIKTVP